MFLEPKQYLHKPLGVPKVPLRPLGNGLVDVLGLFSFPLGVLKVPLRPLGTDRFLLRLRSDLGGVLLFRIHCQEAAVLRLCGLGCVMFFVYVLGLFSSP